MADFTPTTWNEGIAPGISAAQLNRMEAGIDQAKRPMSVAVTPVQVYNTTSETTLFSYTIPANAIEDEKGWIDFEAWGDSVWNSVHNPVFRFKLAGTTELENIWAETPAGGAEERGWRWRMVLSRDDDGPYYIICEFEMGDANTGGGQYMKIAKTDIWLGRWGDQISTDFSTSTTFEFTAKYSEARTDAHLIQHFACLAMYATS